MDKVTKVLIVPSWYKTKEESNQGMFFLSQALALKEEQVHVGIVFSEVFRSVKRFSLKMIIENHFQYEKSKEDGLDVYRYHGWNIYPKYRMRRNIFWVKTTVKLIEKYIQDNGKPDIIHVHSALWGGVAALEIKKRYGIPYVITEHFSRYATDYFTTEELKYAKVAFDNSSYNMAVSNALTKVLEEKLGVKNVQVVNNLVDTEFFISNNNKENEGSTNKFRFLFVGFLTEIKNVNLLIEAFKNAFALKDNVELYILGDGASRSSLEDQSKEFSNITFLGAGSRQKVKEEMEKSDVIVLPSKFETFGVVLIEAMAMGKPVIATDSGGPKEFVNKDNGILVKANDVKELSSALMNIKLNYNNFSNKKIRKYAIENFSKYSIISKLIQIYEKVCDK